MVELGAVLTNGGFDSTGDVFRGVVQVSGQTLHARMLPAIAPLELNQFVGNGPAGDDQGRRFHGCRTRVTPQPASRRSETSCLAVSTAVAASLQ